MGLRALRPSAAIVKVMSVPDSRCIRMDYKFDGPKGMDLMGSSSPPGSGWLRCSAELTDGCDPCVSNCAMGHAG